MSNSDLNKVYFNPAISSNDYYRKIEYILKNELKLPFIEDPEKADIIIVEDGTALNSFISRNLAKNPKIIVAGNPMPFLSEAIDLIKQGADQVFSVELEPEQMMSIIKEPTQKKIHIIDNSALVADQEKGLSNATKWSYNSGYYSSDELVNNNLMGVSDGMIRVLSDIKTIAPTRAAVMVYGPTGSGKELVAKTLHENSGRKGKFVAINCGAISSELFESTMFGHKKGSFTGAIADSKGAFEQAEGGTLFLDEIGEMSMDHQRKILRALQESMIRPVGSEKDIPVNVRIITATHKDLPELIENGLFREDLFYRLSAFPMEVPSLSERREDVGLIAGKIIHELSMQEHKSVKLSENTLKMLEDLPWEKMGNIRGLGNILTGAFYRTAGNLVEPEQINASMHPSMRKSSNLATTFEKFGIKEPMVQGNVTPELSEQKISHNKGVSKSI